MSLGSSPEAVTNFVQTVMIVNYCDLAIMGLLIYDMAITFADEYQHMWKGKKTGVTMIFLSNRYLMLLQYLLAPITDCIRFYDHTSCPRLERTRAAFSALCGIVICIFSSFRVYAISRRHWYAIAVAVLQMANWGINCYLLGSAGFFTMPPPLFGCTPVNRLSPDVYNRLVIPGRSFMIASDAIVLYVTWKNTYGVRRAALNAQFKTPLLTLLLRDGTLYFLLTITLNITILGLWFNASLKFFPNLIQPIQSVLITHFLLNLRDVSTYQGPSNYTTATYPTWTQTRTQASTLLFAIDIVGNMGAPLRHGFTESDQFTEFTNESEEPRADEEEAVAVEPQQGTFELKTIRKDEVEDEPAEEGTRKHESSDHDVG